MPLAVISQMQADLGVMSSSKVPLLSNGLEGSEWAQQPSPGPDETTKRQSDFNSRASYSSLISSTSSHGVDEVGPILSPRGALNG
jgi:hypothetical protein